MLQYWLSLLPSAVEKQDTLPKQPPRVVSDDDLEGNNATGGYPADPEKGKHFCH